LLSWDDVEGLVKTTSSRAYELGLVNCITIFDVEEGTIFCEKPSMPNLESLSLEELTFDLIAKAKGFESLPDNARAHSSNELLHYAQIRAQRLYDLIKEDSLSAVQYSISDELREEFPLFVQEHMKERLS
jgi:hypothetical protein